MSTEKALHEAAQDVIDNWDQLSPRRSPGGLAAAVRKLSAALEEPPRTPDEQALFEAARRIWVKDGECEIDENAIVSISDDGGAYVAAWVWVYNEDAGLPAKE